MGGSEENGQQECLVCLRGACRTVNGIYTRPDLPPGYSLVAQVPKGACGLHVQQIKHTQNILGEYVSKTSVILHNCTMMQGKRKLKINFIIFLCTPEINLFLPFCFIYNRFQWQKFTL